MNVYLNELKKEIEDMNKLKNQEWSYGFIQHDWNGECFHVWNHGELIATFHGETAEYNLYQFFTGIIDGME